MPPPVSPEDLARIKNELNRRNAPTESALSAVQELLDQQFGSIETTSSSRATAFSDETALAVINDIATNAFEIADGDDIEDFNAIYSTVAQHLFIGPLDESPFIDEFTDDAINSAISQTILERQQEIEQHPDAPTTGLQVANIMEGMRREGRLSDEGYDAFINRAGASPEAIRESANALSVVSVNRKDILDESARYSGDLDDAVVSHIRSETPEQLLRGETLYVPPDRQSLVGESRSGVRSETISKLAKTPTQIAEEALRQAGVEKPIEALDPDGHEAYSAALALMKNRVQAVYDDTFNSNPEFTAEQIAEFILDDAVSFVQDGGFEELQENVRENFALQEEQKLAEEQAKKAEKDQLIFSDPNALRKRVEDTAFFFGINPKEDFPEGAVDDMARQAAAAQDLSIIPDLLTFNAPDLFRQKANQDFLEGSDSQRGDRIRERFGLQNERGLTFGTAEQQAAFQSSQDAAVQELDRQIQQGIQSDPNFDINSFSPFRFRQPPIQLETKFPAPPSSPEAIQNVIEDRNAAEANSIPGLYPFQVPLSEDEARQFGELSPAPRAVGGLPPLPQANINTRGRNPSRNGRFIGGSQGFDKERLRSFIFDQKESPEFSSFLFSRFNEEAREVSRNIAHRRNKSQLAPLAKSRFVNVRPENFFTKRKLREAEELFFDNSPERLEQKRRLLTTGSTTRRSNPVASQLRFR